MKQPQFVTKPAFTVVGIRQRVKALSPAIPAIWDQFGPRIDQIDQIAEPYVSYGVMDHMDMDVGQLDYMAAVSVSSTDAIPAGMTSLVVPANTYAVFETSMAEIGEAFGYVYNIWMPSSGYQYALGPYFERYGETFNPADPSSPLSIYIPVQKP